METIEVKGFYITHNGDPTVGIFGSSWELNNGFFFENQKELEEFRKELKVLFEGYCGDRVYVDTFEEREKLINNELKFNGE